MNSIRQFLVAGALLTAAAEAQAQQFRAVAVRDPEIPLQLDGVLVNPPPGKNWHFADRTAARVLFGKPPNPAHHTIYATARVTRLNAPAGDIALAVAELRHAASEEYKSQRYEKTSLRFLEDERLPNQCFRIVLHAIDKGSAQAPGTPLTMLGKGRVCVHPVSRLHAVEMMYSERGGGPQWSPGLEEEGEAFLASLRFVELPVEESAESAPPAKTP
jgi:hypothetical protein